jgi:hypothetical protein
MNLELLTEWNTIKSKIAEIDLARAPLVETERKLRAEVMTTAFPEAKEGTNYLNLPNGWRLKGIVKIDRKVDEASLPATMDKLRKMGVYADVLIRNKPELALKEYRGLTAEQMHVMDEALVIKRASSEMELVSPEVK